MNRQRFPYSIALLILLALGLSHCSSGPDLSSPEVVAQGIAAALASQDKAQVEAYLITKEETKAILKESEGEEGASDQEVDAMAEAVVRQFHQNYPVVIDRLKALPSQELADTQIKLVDIGGTEHAEVQLIFDRDHRDGTLQIVLVNCDGKWKMSVLGT